MTLKRRMTPFRSHYKERPRQCTFHGQAWIGHWGLTKLGVSSTELVIRLGLSQPAISQSAIRGERYELKHELKLDPSYVINLSVSLIPIFMVITSTHIN